MSIGVESIRSPFDLLRFRFKPLTPASNGFGAAEAGRAGTAERGLRTGKAEGGATRAAAAALRAAALFLKNHGTLRCLVKQPRRTSPLTSPQLLDF